MSPSDVRLDKVRELLAELEAGRAYAKASDWPDYEDWYDEASEFLTTECSGQWPDTMFRALWFQPQETGTWVALNADAFDSIRIEADKKRAFARASGKAVDIFKRMLDGPVPWKRPYGMEPPKLERSGMPTAIYAGGDVLINVGTIASSQIQQGTSGSTQTMAQAEIDGLLSGLLEFVGAAREATRDKEAVRDKITPIVDGIETAARAAKPSVPTIKSLLVALGGLLTAGDRVTAIADRIPALIGAVDKLLGIVK